MRGLFGVLFIGILLVLAAATFAEQAYGTVWASQHVYHAPWFVGLWALLAAVSVIVIVRKRLWKRRAVAMLHGSLLVILAGAAVTFFTSQSGMMHIREGQTEYRFVLQEDRTLASLPFSVQLDSFRVSCYPGTDTPADFQSFVTIVDARQGRRAEVISMNHILSLGGYRLYQSSYDEDRRGTILSVRYDPIGTPVTYVGYLLLAVSMVWMLCDRRERFRHLLRQVSAGKAAVVTLLLYIMCGTPMQARSLPTVNAGEAEQMARRQIVYNGRIVTFDTMARDFVLKVYGKSEYHGLSAEQVVCGWLARPEVWKDEPIVRVKDGSLRRQLGAESEYVSVQSLFNADGSYKLYAMQENGMPSKAMQELDEKIGIILMLTQGSLFAPLPADAPSLSNTRVEAEIFYNRMPLVKMLFMGNLTLGILSLVLFVLGFSDRKGVKMALQVLFCLSLLLLLFLYALRWYVSGHVPLGNGYETMLFMSLVIMLVSGIIGRRFWLMQCMGLLLSGFTLLVAHLSDGNPQITHLMPVLNSPLLNIHVSVIMMAYALLGMTCIIAVIYFALAMLQRRHRPAGDGITRQLTLLSQLLLYPAVFMLACGIFIGAVWANVSWGTYWSWDPKEVWALITMLVYAIPFHPSLTEKRLRTPARYHLFMALAFLTILMTYFGVNYFLGGMHSYA